MFNFYLNMFHNLKKSGYKISPKPCRVPGRSTTIEGTCMFVWECIKSEGTHVGVCMDTFMFGSCCTHNTSVNSITGASSSFSIGSTTRPSLAEVLVVSDTTTTMRTTTQRLTKPLTTSHYEASQAGSYGKFFLLN